MKARYAITLTVHDKYGSDSWSMATDTDEFPVFSERFVEDVRAPMVVPGLSLMSFDTVVRALKEREFRKELLKAAAIKLADRLGNYIEDSEGWHGESRRDRIKGRPTP